MKTVEFENSGSSFHVDNSKVWKTKLFVTMAPWFPRRDFLKDKSEITGDRCVLIFLWPGVEGKQLSTPHAFIICHTPDLDRGLLRRHWKSPLTVWRVPMIIAFTCTYIPFSHSWHDKSTVSRLVKNSAWPAWIIQTRFHGSFSYWSNLNLVLAAVTQACYHYLLIFDAWEFALLPIIQCNVHIHVKGIITTYKTNF